MNQILVTEKIYVTPELKRKKKVYRILFILSVLLIIAIGLWYIYGEYDRNRDESISKDILSFLKNDDETTISSTDNALIVLLTDEPTDVNDGMQEEAMKSVGIDDSEKYLTEGMTN